MPPRHTYWTILIGTAPTAFRAREREELLPTFERLRATQPDAVLRWFERGRLWNSPEDARRPREAPPREFRGRDWRPGGSHRDPRDRFKGKGGSQGRGPKGEGFPQGRGPKDEGRRFPPRPKGEGFPQGRGPKDEGRRFPPRPKGEGFPQGRGPKDEGRRFPPRPKGEGFPQGRGPKGEGRRFPDEGRPKSGDRKPATGGPWRPKGEHPPWKPKPGPRDTKPRDTKPRDTKPRDTKPRDGEPRDERARRGDTRPFKKRRR